jgi:hypothetical protein
LIRINAGTFGAKMVNGVGRISPTSEIWSAKFRQRGPYAGAME